MRGWYKLQILTVLQARLGGKCSGNLRTCPKVIEKTSMNEGRWKCSDCVHMFEDIPGLKEEAENLEDGNPCPCCSKLLETGTVLARLDEEIEMLKDVSL